LDISKKTQGQKDPHEFEKLKEIFQKNPQGNFQKTKEIFKKLRKFSRKLEGFFFPKTQFLFNLKNSILLMQAP